MFKYLLASMMLPVFTCASAQVNTGNLTILPAKPVPGKSIELNYHSLDNKFDTGKELEAVVYQFAGYSWRADTALMIKSTTDYKANFVVDPGASFLAFKFYQGSLRFPSVADNSAGKGYGIVLTDKKGRKLRGGALAAALFKLPASNGGIQGYFDGNAPRVSVDSLSLLLNEELKQKNTSPASFAHAYLSLERIIQGEQFKNEAPAMLNKLLAEKQLPEDALSEIYRVAQYELKDGAFATQIRSRLLTDYPKGDFARFETYQKILGSGGKKEQIITAGERFLSDFPISEWRKKPNQQGFIYYEAYRILSTAYFESGDFTALQRLRKDWDFKTENEIYRWNIERAYMLKNVPLNQLQPLADSLFFDLTKKLKDNSYHEDFNTAEQAQANADHQLSLRIGNEIGIHNANADYAKALSFYQYFSPADLYAASELNAIHIDLLDKTGQQKMVLPVLEESVRANAVTPEMFARLKEIYTKQHSNAAGYEQYLASLKSAAEVEKLKEAVKAGMINHDMMPFALEDLNGKLVRSSDWDGKIVVIDFWATWCRPCIAAFPGMQMLVDKYANDPKVAVYFIGTMQFGDYKQKVKDFITREGWRFNVLHDGVNPKTGEQNAVFSTVASFFSSSGIPRKIILKDGVMRYTAEGYSGNPSQLADELSLAIETLKAEK